jgi:peptide subunit release factor 1 (eRF1)
MFTQKNLKALNKIKTKTPTVSLYLNTDQQFYKPEEIFNVQKTLLKEARGLIGKDACDAINQKIKLRLNKKIKGMAFFINPKEGIWQIFQFPKPFLSKVYIEKNLHIKPLVNMFDEYERFCTVVIDKEKARIFLTFLGEIEEFSTILDKSFPGKHAQGGWSQRGNQEHIEVHLLRHLKKVADQTYKFFKKSNFDRLIIAGSKEALPKFESSLHSDLKKRLAGKFLSEMFMDKEHFLKQSLAVEEKIEKEKEREQIKKFLNTLGIKNKAVSGLEETLLAAQEKKILKLFLNMGYKKPGFHCAKCDSLFTQKKEKCPYCNNEIIEEESDIVDELVQKVLDQGGIVEFVLENPELRKVGNVGALLRFK